MKHIPAGLTRDAGVLSFEEALRPSGPVDYDRERWIYIPDRYSEYRYLLGTAGVRPLICVGINPSTARPDALDNTLKSVERIALGNGYDSFLMYNVYAQRATDPDDMEPELNEELHRENLKAFRWALEHGGETPSVWAAWGAIIEKRAYLMRCVADLESLSRSCGVRWYTAGPRSRAGHPHHPLYLKKDSPLEPFDLHAYLNRG